jgi:hypothetical protein
MLPHGHYTYSFMKPFPGQVGAHFSPFCPWTGEKLGNNAMVMAKATEAWGIIIEREEDAGKNALRYFCQRLFSKLLQKVRLILVKPGIIRGN